MTKNQEIEELKKYLLDPRKDYRKELSKFRVNNNGDLQTMSRDGRWETLIPKQRLAEPDWISHMKEKGFVNFGEFICAYFKALEIQGIRNLQIAICGFGYNLADSKFRVNNNGDLQTMSRNGQWETLIPRQRLIEPDWISHMKEKCLVNFGEFICAYFKALEMQGIHNLQIVLYGFDDGFKFADGK